MGRLYFRNLESRMRMPKMKARGLGGRYHRQGLVGKRKKGQKYSKEFRDFAVTLFYYSPRAYKYVAKLFSMPNLRTIRRWTTAVDALPGIFLCMSFHLKCFQYSYELGNKVIFLLPAVQLIGGVAQVARRQVLNACGGDCDGMDSDASQSSLAFHTKLQHI